MSISLFGDIGHPLVMCLSHLRRYIPSKWDHLVIRFWLYCQWGWSFRETFCWANVSYNGFSLIPLHRTEFLGSILFQKLIEAKSLLHPLNVGFEKARSSANIQSWIVSSLFFIKKVSLYRARSNYLGVSRLHYQLSLLNPWRKFAILRGGGTPYAWPKIKVFQIFFDLRKLNIH